MQTERLAVEFRDNAWNIDLPGRAKPVRAEQLIVDATFLSKHFVEGRIKAVHGIDINEIEELGVPQIATLGLKGNLGPPPAGNVRRVRLMPDGSIEHVTWGAG